MAQSMRGEPRGRYDRLTMRPPAEEVRAGDYFTKTDTAERARLEAQDKRFVDRLRQAFENGEFPGQVTPVLVLRG